MADRDSQSTPVRDVQQLRYRWSLEWRLSMVLLATAIAISLILTGVVLLPPALWPLSLPLHMQQALAAVLLIGACLMVAHRCLRSALQPIRSLGNVIDAIRLGDYSLRVRTDRPGIIRELATDINRLSVSQSGQAQGVVESRAMIAKLVTALPLPWFVFDDQGRLRLTNPTADRMLGSSAPVGINAAALGLDKLMLSRSGATVQVVLPGASGRYVVHQETFRERGERYQLLLLVEVETALRAERQQAWESLVRVLAHEINNSLAPIKSIAETLADMLKKDDELSTTELQAQLQRIAHRASSLVSFVHNYASIARLPQPQMKTVQINQLIRHCIDLQPAHKVSTSGEALTIKADPVLLEQALINLLKNADDSASHCNAPKIDINWRYEPRHAQPGLLIAITDNGVGLSATDNLFVPFFTTKPGGSGVGLLLTRRIAELHGGTLSLRNRADNRSGAVAELWLPMSLESS